MNLKECRLESAESYIILTRAREMNYNMTHTARSLDIGIRTLQRKLKRLGYMNKGSGHAQDNRDNLKIFVDSVIAGYESEGDDAQTL